MNLPEGDAASVYPVREDTELLRPFATGRPGAWLADIGTGNGALALAAARAGLRVVATDLNRAALAALARISRAEGLPIVAVRTDLFRGLRPVDRIVSNPPYLPTPRGVRDGDPGDDLALNGGPDGCRVTARIVGALPRQLTHGGRAYILVSSLQSASRLSRLRARFRARGGRVGRVAARPLSGERLEVWEWRPGRSRATGAALRTGRSRPGTGGRRRDPRRRRRASSRGSGPGRTRARGGASGRRRSPPGL